MTVIDIKIHIFVTSINDEKFVFKVPPELRNVADVESISCLSTFSIIFALQSL